MNHIRGFPFREPRHNVKSDNRILRIAAEGRDRIKFCTPLLRLGFFPWLSGLFIFLEYRAG